MMKKILLHLTLIVFFFITPLSINPAYASYSVAGTVINEKTGRGMPGSLNNSIFIYADNTNTTRSYPDESGFWRLDNLSDGVHSIEIANAGSGGFAPASSEKVLVNTQRGDIVFRVFSSYDVIGNVRDLKTSRGIGGITLYSDFGNRASTTTDGFGNYRLTGITYGGNGHTIYVQPNGDWQAAGRDYLSVNPSPPQSEIRADFILQNVSTDGGSPFFPTPTSFPTFSSASCTVSVYWTSGSQTPTSVILYGTFTSNNTSLYYPLRYDWDFNGDTLTDASSDAPQRELAKYSSLGYIQGSGTFSPRLKVYNTSSSSPVECITQNAIMLQSVAQSLYNYENYTPIYYYYPYSY